MTPEEEARAVPREDPGWYAEWRDLEGWIRRVARSVCHRSQEVDDVLQDTFLYMLRRFPLGESVPLDLKAYLGRAIRSTYGLTLRATARERGLDLAATGDPMADAADADARVREELAHLLAKIPRQSRRWLYQHHIHGRSYGELSGTSGVSASTIRSRISRDLRAIRGASEQR